MFSISFRFDFSVCFLEEISILQIKLLLPYSRFPWLSYIGRLGSSQEGGAIGVLSLLRLSGVDFVGVEVICNPAAPPPSPPSRADCTLLKAIKPGMTHNFFQKCYDYRIYSLALYCCCFLTSFASFAV